MNYVRKLYFPSQYIPFCHPAACPYPHPAARSTHLAICHLRVALHGSLSIIAALQCVQPYSSNMLREGKDRIIGTLAGAFWGSAILFLELLPVGGDFRTTVVFYILLGIFTGLVIYSTVLLNISQYALFAAVVFLGIAVYHIEDANPFIHVFYRTLETIIGVGVAIIVNSLHFPRVRDRETLFVSGIDHVLFREDRELSRFTKVELNRFLHDGMRFSVSTKQTPATVREILSGVDLRLPIIAMDGAVLYDLRPGQPHHGFSAR